LNGELGILMIMMNGKEMVYIPSGLDKRIWVYGVFRSINM